MFAHDTFKNIKWICVPMFYNLIKHEILTEPKNDDLFLGVISDVTFKALSAWRSLVENLPKNGTQNRSRTGLHRCTLGPKKSFNNLSK